MTAWIVSEVNSFPADSPCHCPRGRTPNRGAKELRSPRTFNHNPSAKLFAEVGHSGEDRLYSRSWKQQSKHHAVCSERCSEPVLDRAELKGALRTSQWERSCPSCKAPVRDNIEAVAALRNEAFDISEGRVTVWKNRGNPGTELWLLLTSHNNIRAFSLLITIIYANHRMALWCPWRNAMGTCPISVHGTSAICGEQTYYIKQWSASSTRCLFSSGAKKKSEHLEKPIITFKNPCEFFSIHVSLLVFCYGQKKKKPHKIVLKPNQRERKKKKQNIAEGSLKPEITSKSVLHYCSWVETRCKGQPLPHTAGKLKLLLRACLRFLMPHPPSRNWDSGSVVVSFQRGKLF